MQHLPPGARARHRAQACARLALWGSLTLGGVANATTEPVSCQITGLDLQFPEEIPIVNGQQWGQGHVEVRCTNTAAQPRLVDLAVVGAPSTARATRTWPHNPAPMAVRFYTDPTRKQALSHLASDHKALRGLVRVNGHSTSTQKLPIYAAFELTTLMAAGTHNGEVPLKLIYQARR